MDNVDLEKSRATTALSVRGYGRNSPQGKTTLSRKNSAVVMARRGLERSDVRYSWSTANRASARRRRNRQLRGRVSRFVVIVINKVGSGVAAARDAASRDAATAKAKPSALPGERHNPENLTPAG